MLRPLVAAASSWPPSALQHPALDAAIRADANGGDAGADLESLLSELEGIAFLEPATPLRAALLPWALSAPLTTGVVRAARDGNLAEVEAAWERLRLAPHALARDVARAAAERALGHPVPGPAPRADAP